MHTTVQDQAIHVAGIELRTTNQEAHHSIPLHWQRFATEEVAARMPGKVGDTVYAVYTHFQDAGRSNAGLYSLVLGVATDPAAPLPEGMVRAVVPASERAVFAVEAGRFDLVGSAWQGIWARTDLHKSFIADYERYGTDGQISIHIGIIPAQAPTMLRT